ncbi:MAG TPA: hypothetical protein VGG75_16660 [Trebonia sp.]|jgi:hypothetical protein
MASAETDLVTTVTAGDRPLRAAIRRGTGGGPPLLVCNGTAPAVPAQAPRPGSPRR